VIGAFLSAVDKITRVLTTDLLSSELTVIPRRGATDLELAEEQIRLGKQLCSDHIAILRRWNGLDLELVRLFGCGSDCRSPGRLADRQSGIPGSITGGIIVANDPAGFVYIQLSDRRLMCYDPDGGEVSKLSASLDEFIDQVVFGLGAASFAGEEWLGELQDAGIV
jgi:hypothetical protein